MERNGKTLKVIEDGAPRRMADGKNAWRKMNEEQRARFLDWIRFGDDAPDSRVLDAMLDSPTGPLLSEDA